MPLSSNDLSLEAYNQVLTSFFPVTFSSPNCLSYFKSDWLTPRKSSSHLLLGHYHRGRVRRTRSNSISFSHFTLLHDVFTRVSFVLLRAQRDALLCRWSMGSVISSNQLTCSDRPDCIPGGTCSCTFSTCIVRHSKDRSA